MICNNRRKDDRFFSRFVTVLICVMTTFIPTCMIFKSLSDNEQAIAIIAPAIDHPSRALGTVAAISIFMYLVLFCAMSGKRLELIQIGLVVLVCLALFVLVTGATIYSNSFENTELSNKRMNRSEKEMRRLLETSVDGLDGMQISLQCCGVDNYTDWNSNANFTCVSPPLTKYSCYIPVTCCKEYHNVFSEDVSYPKALYIQTTRVHGHCGKAALKPFVGLPYETPEESNSVNNFKDMKRTMILEEGCLKKSKQFLSEYCFRNMILACIILATQLFYVAVNVGCYCLIHGDTPRATGQARLARARARARARSNGNSQGNAAVQPRRNSNEDHIPETFELREVDATLNIPTYTETDTESDAAASVYPEDTESGKSSASVKLSDIEPKKPLATTNPKHSESRNDAAATNLSENESMRENDATLNIPTYTETDTESDAASVYPADTVSGKSSASVYPLDTESGKSSASAYPVDTESGKSSASVKLSDIEPKKPVATTNPKHSESRNDAAAASLTENESMEGADGMDDVNLSIFEPRNESEAYTTNDVGSRRNSSESECGICVKNSPTYIRVSALFQNTAGYKVAGSQETVASEDSDVDPAKSYLYDWNEMFFRTTDV